MLTQSLAVPLLATKYATAWPKPENDVEVGYESLGDVLKTPVVTDAHFGTYHVPGVPRRLKKKSVTGNPRIKRVPLIAAVFDVDDPAKVHEIAREDWWAAERGKIERLIET